MPWKKFQPITFVAGRNSIPLPADYVIVAESQLEKRTSEAHQLCSLMTRATQAQSVEQVGEGLDRITESDWENIAHAYLGHEDFSVSMTDELF